MKKYTIWSDPPPSYMSEFYTDVLKSIILTENILFYNFLLSKFKKKEKKNAR